MSSVTARPAPKLSAAIFETAVLWDRLAMAGLAVLLVLVVATFGEYGVSNDEDVQHRYGAKLLAFYLSGFADRSALGFENLYLYGGLFDMVAVLLHWLTPGSDGFAARHLLSGLVGVGGIAAVWRLARLLAGPRAGFIALALLALAAPWYGAMFNHTKDIPFATATAWLLYFACRCVGDLPRPDGRALAGLALSAGAALGLRAGALLYAAYIAVPLAIWATVLWRRDGMRALAAAARPLCWRLALVLLLAYALMAFFWPWSVQAPLNPLRALVQFSHFKYDIDTLFAGRVIKMYDVPGYYAPVYIAIRLPLVVLAGLALSCGLLAARIRRQGLVDLAQPRALAVLLVVLAAVLPLLSCLLARPYLYSGMRHFFFVVPPLVVIAALGLDGLIERAAAIRRWLAAMVAAGLVATGAALAVEMAALHPHQYLSYNMLVGGLPGALGRWDTDYWNNTAPEAVDGIVARVAAEGTGSRPAARPIRIAICGDAKSIAHEVPAGFAAAEDWSAMEFIVLSTHIGCQNSFPAAPVLFEIRRLGVTLAVVRDLRRRTGSAR